MAGLGPIVVVQGGAAVHALIQEDGVDIESIRKGVVQAAKAGYQVLSAGGGAVDAVEAAVAAMEDCDVFNAGRGSCLTVDGKIEMDASIMDGSTLDAGGVACITNVANPVKVARLVMDKTEHVLLVGEGATKFAKEVGAKMVTTEDLVTNRAKHRLQNFAEFKPSLNVEFLDSIKKSGFSDKRDHDTVGAVALDSKGNVAYATSTGGINAKMVGRAGDSPVIGSGGYADNTVGAVSTTGHGESFMKVTCARRVIFQMEQGKSAQKASEEAMSYTLKRVGGTGGCVTVGNKGDVGIHFTTEGMPWAVAREGLVKHGVYPEDDRTEKA